MPHRLIPFALALVFLSPLAWADITGQPRVIDGDTLEVAGQRIRLHGIDAPEGRQPCYRDGKPWRCGEGAANALAGKIDAAPSHARNAARIATGAPWLSAMPMARI